MALFVIRDFATLGILHIIGPGCPAPAPQLKACIHRAANAFILIGLRPRSPCGSRLSLARNTMARVLGLRHSTDSMHAIRYTRSISQCNCESILKYVKGARSAGEDAAWRIGDVNRVQEVWVGGKHHCCGTRAVVDELWPWISLETDSLEALIQ